MNKKERRIALTVMTREAMELCLQEEVPLFCIENPLYSQVYPRLQQNQFEDYRIEVFEEKNVIMLTKVRGKNTFDEQRYERFYLPLQWDHWHS